MVKAKNKLDSIEIDEKFEIIDQKLDMVDDRLIKMDEKIDEKFDVLNNKFDKMMNNMDWLMGEYKKSDEENTVSAYRQSEHTDEIEELKKRVAKLERLVQQLTAQ